MIISVMNAKGGVGKTTTALNLAACFHQSGHQAVAIDLDTTQRTLLKYAATSEFPIVTGNAAELETLIAEHKAKYIILDCGPSLEKETVEALRLTDLCVVPAKPETPDVDGLREFFSILRGVRQKTGRNVPARVVFTMCGNNAQHNAIIATARALSIHPVCDALVPRRGEFARAATQYRAVIDRYPNSVGAAAYSAVANEILKTKTGVD